MTTFQKLKHEARRAEQRSDWARAIDLYQQALDADEDMADLSLYNRIGDLHLRLGENEAAVESYERAVERYADNAMHTSAIALCNKILRIAPGRVSVYRRLAVLHARTGLVVEGRNSMMAYVRHVLAEADPEEAAVAVAEFVELTDDEEICLQFAAELNERDEKAAAAEQLRAAVRLRTGRGEDAADLQGRIAELDPDGVVAADEAPEPAGSTEPVRREPDRLAGLVARRLAEQGSDVAFRAEVPPEDPVREARSTDELDTVRRQADRFRRRVAEVLESGDPTVRYDLGVEFMTIGLLEEAIEEFRHTLADPRLLEAANARIGECLALRGSEASFEVIRRASRVSPDRERSGTADVRKPPSPEAQFEDEMADDDASGREAADDPAVDEPVLATEESPADREPSDDTGPPDGEEDELQGHFFRARLAQYRIRQAEKRHKLDHSAHLDLGTAYIEMGLHEEALRELGVALRGPRSVSGRASRVLEELAFRLGEAPRQALDVVELLAGSGREPAAEALGRRLNQAWGDDHPLAEELADLRDRLRDAVDELPALEDMFPALRETVTDGEADEDSASGDPRDVALPEAAAGNSGLSVRPEAPDTDDPGPSVDQVLFRATELVSAGDVESAIEHLRASFASLDAGHRTREALIVLDRLLELQPDDVAVHQQRTELATMVNDRDQLLAAFAALGACLRRLGDMRRARAAYGRMLDIDPSNELARQATSRIDEAEVKLERESRERDGTPTTAAASSDADVEAEAEVEADDEELGAMFEFLDGLDDTDVQVVSGETEADAVSTGEDSGSEDQTARSRYELGQAFRQMGMWDEALRELRPTLDRATDRLGVLEAIAECLVRLGRPADAIALLQSRLRSDEDAEQVGPLYFLGLALQAEGEPAGAREVFARVEAAHAGYRDTADRLSELSL